jgi:hypothetical protein
MRFFKRFLGILLCLLATSCTSKIALRFVDWQIVWWVEEYVSLDISQQKEFDSRLQKQLVWHKKKQLPVYSQFLRQIKADLDYPWSEEQMAERVESVRTIWTETLNHVSIDLVFMLSELREDQIREIVDHLYETIENDEEDYSDSTADERMAAKIKRTKKLVKRFIGRLNKDQILLIEQWSGAAEDNQLAWIENRKNWTGSLHEALKSRNDPGFQNRVTQLIVNSDHLWDDADRIRARQNYKKGTELTIAVLNTLTEKQHIYVREMLDDWIDTFDDFSGS